MRLSPSLYATLWIILINSSIRTGLCDHDENNDGICTPNSRSRSSDDTSSPTSRLSGILAALSLYAFIYTVCSFTSAPFREELRLRRAKLRCLYFFGNGCLCRERQLRRAIHRNRDAAICISTTITLTKEVDLTGKSFNISCLVLEGKRKACKLIGNGRTRLFKGSPTNAVFDTIDFAGGSADEGGIALLTGGKAQFLSSRMESSNTKTGNGGALSITGGSHVLNGVNFQNNAAKGNGGAISITGGTIESTFIGFENNVATNGGAMYLAKGARASMGSSSMLATQNLATLKGGAFYLDRASLFLNGSVWNNNASGALDNIWIADDEDPATGSGSQLTCGLFSSKGFCGLDEFGGGPNNTQLFANSNCTSLLSLPIAQVCPTGRICVAECGP